MKRTPLKRKSALQAAAVRECLVCGEEFRPYRSTDRACCARHEMELVAKDKARREEKRVGQAVPAERSRSSAVESCQAAFNALVVALDGGQPCISCGHPAHIEPFGGWECGHLRTVGACPELRFERFNANKQCHQCNQHLAGNVDGHRDGIVARYGEEQLAWVDGYHPPRKYTTDELLELAAGFRREKRLLDRAAQA